MSDVSRVQEFAMRDFAAALMAVFGFAWAGAGIAYAQEPQEGENAAAESTEQGDPHAGGHPQHLGEGNATASQDSPADFKTDLAIYTFVVFLLLLGILSTMAWPKISQALEEREKRIEASIAAAAAKHEEAKRLLAEHEAKLAGAAAEVRALLEEARRDAEVTKVEIVSEAKTAAQQERDRALRDIDIAKDHALKSLAETSANLAVELAGKAIRETIKPEKQAEIIRDALAKLHSSNPSQN
jgi:F-type H+-transporting ATPase subunit b